MNPSGTSANRKRLALIVAPLVLILAAAVGFGIFLADDGDDPPAKPPTVQPRTHLDLGKVRNVPLPGRFNEDLSLAGDKLFYVSASGSGSPDEVAVIDVTSGERSVVARMDLNPSYYLSTVAAVQNWIVYAEVTQSPGDGPHPERWRVLAVNTDDHQRLVLDSGRARADQSSPYVTEQGGQVEWTAPGKGNTDLPRAWQPGWEGAKPIVAAGTKDAHGWTYYTGPAVPAGKNYAGDCWRVSPNGEKEPVTRTGGLVGQCVAAGDWVVWTTAPSATDPTAETNDPNVIWVQQGDKPAKILHRGLVSGGLVLAGDYLAWQSLDDGTVNVTSMSDPKLSIALTGQAGFATGTVDANTLALVTQDQTGDVATLIDITRIRAVR